MLYATDLSGKTKAMGDTPKDNDTCPLHGDPKLMPPPRGLWMLALWAALLVAVLVGQWATAHSFDHGHWTPDGCTEPTGAELLWYRLPIGAIVLLAAVFFVGLRRWVSRKGTRGILFAWGILFSFVSILVSIGISLWFHVYFYMD